MIIVLAVAILAAGVGIRLWHLTGSHYPLLGPDSYYFAWLAEQDNIPVLKSGLAYTMKAMPWSEYILPVVFYVALSMLIYVFVCKHWGVRAALISLVVAAILPECALLTSAGWVDRDGLVLLITSTAVVITLSSYRIWIRAAVVIALAVFVGVFWVPLGVIILSLLCIGAATAKYMISDRQRDRYDYLNYTISASAFLAVIIGISCANPGTVDSVSRYIGYNSGISEVSGMSIATTVQVYGMLLPIVVIGAWKALRAYRTDRILPVMGFWLIAVAISAILAQRMLLFAIYPAVVVASVLIDSVFSWVKDQPVSLGKKRAVLAFLGCVAAITIVATVYQDTRQHQYRHMVASASWVDACEYLEQYSDAEIVCHWNYGKWVQYLAKKRPDTCNHYDCSGGDLVIAPSVAELEYPVMYRNEEVVIYAKRDF